MKCTTASFDEAKFAEVVAKMEDDAFEFAQYVETLYKDRCNTDTIAQCADANYEDCFSLYPNPICPAGDNYEIEHCTGGSAASCSALYDFSIS